MRITITVQLVGKSSAKFTDAFNEWARDPEIDALMARTLDTPSGDPESDYSFTFDPAYETGFDWTQQC